jgi:ABC-type spermidine/putrescine transport system permease subunit II
MPVAAAPVLTFPELGAQLAPVESTRDGALVEVTTHFKRRAHWWQSSALIVGNVVGTGVLSMPYAAAGLGWVMSAFALLIFAFASTYAGVLLARVRNDFHPKCSSYAELAYAIAGRRFGLFTRCMVVSGWVMLLPYYLIGTADSLRVLFQADAVLCTWQWTSIVALLLLEPSILTLTLGHILICLPYVVRTMGAAIQGIDPTIEEAARNLGAGRWQVQRTVVLPMVRPAHYASILFAFLMSFDNAVISIFLVSARTQTLPISIYNYVQYSLDPAIAAVSTLLMLVSALALWVASRLVPMEKLGR